MRFLYQLCDHSKIFPSIHANSKVNNSNSIAQRSNIAAFTVWNSFLKRWRKIFGIIPVFESFISCPSCTSSYGARAGKTVLSNIYNISLNTLYCIWLVAMLHADYSSGRDKVANPFILRLHPVRFCNLIIFFPPPQYRHFTWESS